MISLVRLLFLFASLCVTFVARADIYAYVDANGVTHFSNVPVDDQYTLLLSDPVVPKQAPDRVWLERSTEFEPIIADAAAATGVDADLLRAVIVVESGFDEMAVSHAGAQGLMQLMPQTAQRFGVSDALDPVQNIHAGAQYLSELIALYDANFELALAAYNAGEDAVERYGNRIPPFDETRAYVPKVLRLYTSLASLSRPI